MSIMKIHSREYYERWADGVIARRKRNRWLNRIWNKIYMYVLFVYISLALFVGAIQFKKDYDLLENYAHFDSYNEGVFATWRTDGSPGQEPNSK